MARDATKEYLSRCISSAHDMMTKLLEIYDTEEQAPDDVCDMVNEFLNLYIEMIDVGIVETYPVDALL